jgi:hypothetical protein
MFRDWMKRMGQPRGAAAKALGARADVRAVAAEDGLAVFDMTRGTVFRSNAVGAEIWRGVIEQGREPGAVAESLAERFGVAREQARDDVDRFVGQLRQEGLVGCR